MKSPLTAELAAEIPEILSKLITIPSFSRDEGAVADAFCKIMEDCGFRPQRKGNNLWLISPDFSSCRPTLLLNAHIDTVKPVAAWQRDPFLPEVEDGRLYGLGSNDCGGGLVTLFQVFRYFCENPQSYNLIYLASAEEEVSGKGGIESVLPELPPISVAIVGEPTGMQPAIAEKGLMVLDCTAEGSAGHAARNEGINAIYRAMEDIEWFRTHQFEKVSPLLGPVKTSVTMISAGTQHNVVPAECKFVVDVRSNELYSNEEIYRQICEAVACKVEARSFRLNSSRIGTDHALVQRCIEAGRKPYGSPTLSDQALMSFPSLKLGPGESARSHTADEYIELRELEEALPLYLQLLDGLTL